jgi:zinc/manganese transport system ATP-binding protein
VRTIFPRTLLLAREGVALGPTSEVLRADNLLRARHLAQTFGAEDAICRHAA